MRIEEIMTPSVATIGVDDTLYQASLRMREHDVGVLPVMRGKDIVGIVSDRDIVLRGVAEGLSPMSSKIRGVMTEGVVTCHMEDTVETASELMTEHKIRRLVIVNDDGRPTGMVSLGDLATHVHNHEISWHVLEEVSVH